MNDDKRPPVDHGLCSLCVHGQVVRMARQYKSRRTLEDRTDYITSSYCMAPGIASEDDPVEMDYPVIDCTAFEGDIDVALSENDVRRESVRVRKRRKRRKRDG